MILFVIYGTLVMKAAIPGWASTVVPVYFLGGIQLLAIGILGEYVAKIYLETKSRPRFFVERGASATLARPSGARQGEKLKNDARSALSTGLLLARGAACLGYLLFVALTMRARRRRADRGDSS
ncbi:MAG: hypothetical protein MZW92_21290 [Comamonadaceae bacterium]|nr:hypothetical protein [Comamonadaceae bacterium]